MTEASTASPERFQTDLQPKDEVAYKGITIEGLDFLENQGITTREKVFDLLNQLPENYFPITQVGKIVFDKEKCYTVKRDDQVLVVKESDLGPEDMIMRRIRGLTVFNSNTVDGKLQATDGKQTITVFSTKEWEDENDEDVALYTLAHEIGHGTWNAIVYGPRIWTGLQELGRINPTEIKSNRLSGVINVWKELPESSLPRYVSYKSEFLRELNREAGALDESELDVSQQEDFATAHEYHLYWHNLESIDADRSNLISVGYEIMGDLT